LLQIVQVNNNQVALVDNAIGRALCYTVDDIVFAIRQACSPPARLFRLAAAKEVAP
jgi:hypothetical protein